jgi:hypothetical protein
MGLGSRDAGQFQFAVVEKTGLREEAEVGGIRQSDIAETRHAPLVEFEAAVDLGNQDDDRAGVAGESAAEFRSSALPTIGRINTPGR